MTDKENPGRHLGTKELERVILGALESPAAQGSDLRDPSRREILAMAITIHIVQHQRGLRGAGMNTDDRTKIVGYLRAEAVEYEGLFVGTAADVIDKLAAAIERGEHLKAPAECDECGGVYGYHGLRCTLNPRHGDGAPEAARRVRTTLGESNASDLADAVACGDMDAVEKVVKRMQEEGLG